MKTSLYLVTTCLSVLLLTGCNDTKPDPQPTPNPSTSSRTQSTPDSTPTSTQPSWEKKLESKRKNLPSVQQKRQDAKDAQTFKDKVEREHGNSETKQEIDAFSKKLKKD